MGVSALPKLPRDGWLGWLLCLVIDRVIYFQIAQFFLAPADYWRDPQNMEGFLKYSKFLAEANNEVNFNQTRKDKWLSLKKAIFVKWIDDTTIIPKESSWWGMYDSNFNIMSRFDTEVYQKDLMGIKTLEEDGRATFETLPGDHMHFSHDDINQM
jgi:palmitoyl-protein thioesterase